MKNTRNDVAPFITLKDNGRVNKLATLEKFNKAVDDFILKTEAQEDLIIDCLNSLFDKYKGARLSQTAITGEVLRDIQKREPQLNSIQLEPKLTKRILEVLHERIELGEYAVKKGPGLGTFRVADQKR